MTSTAIYARVSSARQRQDETIASQTAALRGHAQQQAMCVPTDWVFEDDGHSGATLVRLALEGPARPGRRGRRGRDVVLLAGSAGP
jgi:site-specific DNA recombinase